MSEGPLGAMPSTTKHSHYFKSVRGLETIDVYRVCLLFNITDPCLQHALKKLLVAGGRGAGKNVKQDVQEAIDTLQRYLDIQKENQNMQWHDLPPSALVPA